MVVRIVEFMAFDKKCQEVYLDKSVDEIKDILYKMCYTYQLKKIKEIDLRSVKLKEVEYK